MNLDWFVNEVSAISERLQIVVDGLSDASLPGAINITTEIETNSFEEKDSLVETPSEKSSVRSNWLTTEEPVVIATVEPKPNTAFDIPITPPPQNTLKPKPKLRASSARKAPRPHTIHVDGRGDKLAQRSPSSDGIEIDENRPPDQNNGTAFEISLSPTPNGKTEKKVLSKQRDRFRLKQLEREQEIRRKKFQLEEEKRIAVRQRAAEDDLRSDGKQIENERRKLILENHKAKKLSPSKHPIVTKRYGSALPQESYVSPTRMSRSKSSTIYDPRRDANWDTMSCVSQITTTRVFKEPTSKSNKQLMEMAMKFHALPGPVNKTERIKALDAITNSGANHYMALYKENVYKGLYEVTQVDELLRITKIHGSGPREASETMISELLKFNSGAKNFQLVDGRTLSPAIDGFRLHPNCWLSKRPRTVPSQLN